MASNTTIRQATVLPTAEAGPTRPTKVKVSLRRSPTGQYQLSASHPLPPAQVFWEHFRKINAKKPFLDSFNALYWRGIHTDAFIVSCAMNGVPVKHLAEALLNLICLNLRSQVDTDLERLAIANGGYLSLGNILCRVEPVDYIATGTKALPVLRRAVIDETRQMGETILENARSEARLLVEKASAEATTIRANAMEARTQLEELRRQTQVSIIPEWVTRSNFAVMARNGYLYVGVVFYFRLTAFTFTSRRGEKVNIPANADAPPFPVRVWAPLPTPNFHFSYKDLCLDSVCGNLPHITHESCCMSMGDAPTKLDSTNAVLSFGNSLARVHSIANLDSLLGSLQGWDSRIWAFVPKNTPLERALDETKRNLFHITDALNRNLVAQSAVAIPNTEHDGDTFIAPPEEEGVRCPDCGALEDDCEC